MRDCWQIANCHAVGLTACAGRVPADAVWVEKSSAELELEELLLALPPPKLRPNKLTPPPPDELELCVWLFSTWASALESLEFCCW